MRFTRALITFSCIVLTLYANKEGQSLDTLYLFAIVIILNSGVNQIVEILEKKAGAQNEKYY